MFIQMSSLQEYESWKINSFEFVRKSDQSIVDNLEKQFRSGNSPLLINAYDIFRGNNSDFLVDPAFRYGENNWNLRETVNDPNYFFNCRMRLTIKHLLALKEKYNPQKVYITEYVTPLFTFLQKYFKELEGSEYIPGFKFRRKIPHQDITRLSFPAESFDLIISLEVLEHIPNFESALHEIYRVLNVGGIAVLTFPFNPDNQSIQVRAKRKWKKIIHLLPPEIHGNPVNEKGSLCFQTFGWEIIQISKSIGFSKCVANLYYEPGEAIIGGPQFIFEFFK